MIHPDAQDLLTKLITHDLTKRLGNLHGGSRDVMNHAWFAEVTWERLAKKDIVGQNASANTQNHDSAYSSGTNSAVQHNATPQLNIPGQKGAANPTRETKGKYTLSDFALQRTLGTGSFGRVHLVQSKHNQRFYAVKVLKKAQVVKMKQVEHTNDPS